MPVSPFIARDDELSRITAAWDRLAADGGGPVAVACVGEAGIGKTRLLREAADAVAPTTLLVGTARADGTAPHDWFAAATAGRDAPQGTDPRLWRMLRQEPVEAPMRLPDGVLLRGAMTTLRRIVGDGPALIVVDDLHWLDPESLALWSAMAAEWELPAMLLAGSRAPDEARHPEAVARVLTRLEGARSRVRVALRHLTPDETGALVGAFTGEPVPRAEARAIHRRTGGNPFWVTELANSGIRGTAPLPGHLAALVRARLAGEDRASWTLARGLALLGEQVEAAVAAEVLGPPSFERGLPALVAAGVLRVDGATVRFAHALMREAFAATALPAEAEAVHRAALAAARERGDDAAIAVHALAVGETATAVAAAARTARRQLDSWLAESAQQTAEAALRSAPDHVELLDIAGQAALLAGDFEAGRVHSERLAAIAADAAVQCSNHLRLAELAWHQGRTAEQQAHLDTAQALAAPGSAEHARCLAGRGMALIRSEYPQAIFAICDEAAALCARHGLEAERRSMEISRATALHDVGDADGAVAGLRRIWRDAEADGDLRTLSRAVNNLLAIHLRELPERQAWQLFEQGVAATGDLGMAVWGGKIVRSGADAAVAFGDLDRAWGLLAARVRVEPDPHERAVLAAKAGLLAVERDDLEAAERLCEEGLALVAGMDQGWVITYPHWTAVAIAARRGGRARVEAAMRAYRDAVPPALHERRDYRVLDVARLAIEGGVEPHAARRFVIDCLGAVPGPGSEPSADLMWMTARLGLGDWAGARALVDSAAQGPPVYQAVAHDLAAEAAQRSGDRRRAEAHAREAVALLGRWPGWRRDRASDRLRRLRAASATVALTTREAEVLQAAAAGRSNRQIATALGISQRTVEVHMSRVLAKTGAASRTELVAKLLQGRLDPTGTGD
ncbi:LuxR C-terminal-related transcriptional regulator [Glycomyces sp. TRM65418]|uniref:ATP-binding protein n=1 Tax=Glycomyces sp. TRM65418 TaxID=2867006 RepID=UPI001CE5B1B7|nr:LuxR family transcriptional regulator [Glycomyces sp. TRM65418]MCC3765343.1 LuxR C-terminal-related transcriptional regulator [Glycomyces sp. TRM65418]QZD54960.1 LuxR C-terminal-related transcriptional regulator [Glycomyces sp. TRM65418]